MKRFNNCWCMIALVLANVNALQADEGDPVAIRTWPDGGVTIETMWNLHVGIGLTEAAKRALSREPDLVIEGHSIDGEETLRRLPDEPAPVRLTRPDKAKPNDINFRTVGSLSGEDGEGHSGWSSSVIVDDVRVFVLNDENPDTLKEFLSRLNTPNQPAQSGADVIIASRHNYDDATILDVVARCKPRYVVVNIARTKIGDQEVIAIPHNTLAVSATKEQNNKATQFVSLTDTPYEMSNELADLFMKKEIACKNSRNTFAKLSIDQMNFRPGNGTHTPRWNTEHMMGRELLFFSQIYHEVDPSIPVMDLNPRQMPDDYEMAHPDWTGEEEARQTERVEAFTRRFAYLLEGMDLDRKAKGSKFWTPRALLKQMERHYNEHTANVQKKMELAEWPKQ